MKLAAILCCAFAAAAQTRPPQLITLEATGTEDVKPQLYHVLMKMANSSSQAADASAAGEKQIKEFIQAVEALKIPNLSWRLSNNVYTAMQAPYSQGSVYARNIIFTLPNPDNREERERIVAQLQDLGAKYNSHCVTCVGSG